MIARTRQEKSERDYIYKLLGSDAPVLGQTNPECEREQEKKSGHQDRPQKEAEDQSRAQQQLDKRNRVTGCGYNRQGQPGFREHLLGMINESREMGEATETVHKKINTQSKPQQRMGERQIVDTWLSIGIHTLLDNFAPNELSTRFKSS